MDAPYVRRLTPVERMWLVADDVCPTFANQIVIEADGAWDEAGFRAAAVAASAVHPGSHIVLRGCLGRARWVTTEDDVPVRRVDGRAWDGRRPEGAPFLSDPLDVRRGPACEVLLVEGEPARIVVRSHHAIMDGRGTLLFAIDVFRALRGEPLLGTNSDLDGFTLARSLAPPGKPPRRIEDCLAPTGRAREAEPGVTWRRVSVPGRISRLLPRLAVLVAARARSHGEQGRVRVDVPVDMRPSVPDVRSTANLCGMVHVEMAPDATTTDVADAIAEMRARHVEASGEAHLAWMRGAPLWLMRWVARSSIPRVHRTARYITTASFSNLGVVDLAALQAPGFAPRCAFWIPPGADGVPFFAALAGHSAGLELLTSMPHVLATDGRLDELMGALVDELAVG